jgi:acyl-CoA thioester hydrolase
MKKAETQGHGRLEGREHVLPVRVYFEDTDFSGLVYHASYLRFMERGRSEFLRHADIGHQQMLDAEDPLVWTLRRIAVDFAKPARVEDDLLVRTTVNEVSGARMKLAQAVTRGGEELVTAAVEVCVIGRDGKPRRIPDQIRSKLQAFSRS